MINVPNYIENLVPYKSGNKLEKAITREEFKTLINLASNENPLGPSPKAVEAIQKHLSEINIYPDPSAPELTQKLAEKFGKDANRIITGHGSDSLIQYIFNTFFKKGDELLTATSTFIGTYVNANKQGMQLQLVPMKSDYSYDLNAILGKITLRTKVIYLANPNNPTATMFTKSDFTKFMAKVPKDVLVILDEAYWIYAKEMPGYLDGFEFDEENLIVLRTLSKAYGLAGLRVGFAYAPKYIIDYISRVKLPFEPNTLAQVAAIAALDDEDFIDKMLVENQKSMDILLDAIDSAGIARTEPSANFVMMIFDNEVKAKSMYNKLLENNIITRQLPMFGLPNAIRISTGTVEQTQKAAKIIYSK